jgi:hypothetical protein
MKLIITESVVSHVFKQRNQSGIFAVAMGQHLENHIQFFNFGVRLDQTTLKLRQNEYGFARFYPVFIIVSPCHLILYSITSAVETVC